MTMIVTKVIAVKDPVKSTRDPRNGPNIAFFGGGTGNGDLLRTCLAQLSWNLNVIIPTSDNGGSSLGIRTVLESFERGGGPAIGDFRAILVRIASFNLAGNLNKEVKPILDLLSFRLDKADNELAKKQWLEITQAAHPLWKHIPDDLQPIIHSDLIEFSSVVARSKKEFNYQGACIGNMFLTGARLRMNSLTAAICLFKRVVNIPYETKIIPAIDSNEPHNIACELSDKSIVYGQNEISHPGDFVDKECTEMLPSKIKRLFYYDELNRLISPPANPAAINAIENSKLICYSMGSFWTSIMPSVILNGVGQQIVQNNCPKLLMLGGWSDRETNNMTAIDHIDAFTRTISKNNGISFDPKDLVTHLLYVEGTTIPVDRCKIEKKYGISVIPVERDIVKSTLREPRYSTEEIITELDKLID